MRKARETTVVCTSKPRCLRAGCKRAAEIRGLCRSDYQTAYVLVATGVTTWEQLERKGRVDERRPSPKEWFLAS